MKYEFKITLKGEKHDVSIVKRQGKYHVWVYYSGTIVCNIEYETDKDGVLDLIAKEMEEAEA